jgi:hypothetical protein
VFLPLIAVGVDAISAKPHLRAIEARVAAHVADPMQCEPERRRPVGGDVEGTCASLAELPPQTLPTTRRSTRTPR